MSHAVGLAASLLAIGCCKLPPGVHVRTTQLHYRSGDEVTVVLDNGSGKRIELTPGCDDRLERYDGGAWVPVVRETYKDGENECWDGATRVPCAFACEEEYRPLETCTSLSYRWPLLQTLTPGTYRIRTVAGTHPEQLTTNSFSVSP